MLTNLRSIHRMYIQSQEKAHFKIHLAPFATVFHWAIQFSCVSSGGSTYKSFRCTPPPSTRPFIFTYVFTEKRLCQRLAPPPTRVGPPNGKSWIRPWYPLHLIKYAFRKPSRQVCSLERCILAQF